MCSRNPFPAPGTEIEARGYLLAAAHASLLRLGLETSRLSSPRLIKYSSAPGALQKPLSPFDRDEGNEEEIVSEGDIEGLQGDFTYPREAFFVLALREERGKKKGHEEGSMVAWAFWAVGYMAKC